MALHIYRYQWRGVSVQAINRILSPITPALVAGILPPVLIDMQADDTAKGDLDTAMNQQGWNFLLADPPSTLPAVEPGAHVLNTLDIPLPDSTLVVISFDTPQFNDGGVWSAGPTSNRLTAPLDGKYQISGHAILATNLGGFPGDRILGVRHQPSGRTIAADGAPGTVNTPSSQRNVVTIFRLLAGEFVELIALQNSGQPAQILGSTNPLVGAQDTPTFEMIRLGD